MTKSAPSPHGYDLKGRAIIAWGLGGILLLLARAIFRLAPVALDALTQPLNHLQWVVLGAWVLISAYSEGHRGFHKRFSPRVVSRAFHLAACGTPLQAWLAPAYCMSLFHAARRSRIVAWCFVVGIVALVVAVRALPQPWRGIVDAGVVVGLSWGALSILVLWHRAARRGPEPPPDLPTGSHPGPVGPRPRTS